MTSFDTVPLTLIELMLASIILIGGLLFVFIQGGRQGRVLVWPLLTALLLRAAWATLQRFLLFHPYGGADAVRFEYTAWLFAQSGCGNMLQHFDASESYVISFIYGQLYACTDRAPLAAHYINVVLSVVTVYLIARLAERLWGPKIALRAAWIAALYPELIAYGAVTLREPFVSVGCLAGAYGLVLWIQQKRFRYFLLALLAFLVATAFHGGMVFTLFALAVFLTLRAGYWFFTQNKVVFSRSVLIAGLLLFVLIGAVFVAGRIEIGKFGDITQLSFDQLNEEEEIQSRGNLSYPGFLLGTRSGSDLVWQTPIRMVYLLFGPPLWEVRLPQHVYGTLDGFLYLLVLIQLWRYRALWWHRQEFRVLLLIILVLTFVYGFGSNNFSQAMRHRGKFVGLLIAMVAGLLGKKRSLVQAAGGSPPPRPQTTSA